MLKNKRKTLGRILMMILVLSMLLSIPAYADFAYLNPGAAIFLGNNDPNAIVTDAVIPDPNAPQTRTASLLFSFTGTNVYYMVATSSPKTFTVSSLSKGYLKVSGKGQYSYAESTVQFRVGGCYYNSLSNSYVTYLGQYVVFNNGEQGYGYISKDQFSKYNTYYGFMTNYYQDNVVSLSGTFYLYNSDGSD